jgi:IS5 family transposase
LETLIQKITLLGIPKMSQINPSWVLGLHRARYCGLAKTHAQLAMAAIGQTLLKAANKIKMNPQAQAIA